MSKFRIAIVRPAALVIGSLALILAGTAKADIAAMQQPAPGTTLSSSSVTFSWSTGTNVLQYYLYVASVLGGNDIYSASQGTKTSVTVNNIPTDGRIVYVRLWSFVGGAVNSWQFNDYKYLAAGAAAGGTTTTLTSSANPSAVCQLVTLTAAITPANVTGSVTFFDGSATLGTVSVSGGSASFSTSAFTIGNHQLLASYGGAAGYPPSSGSLVQTVSGSVTVTLSSSPNPSNVNQGVTMTATVAAPACQAAPSPTGSVSFFDGMNQIGQVSVVNGIATFSASTLSVGSHQLSARYGGDTNYGAATSNTVTQSVANAGTTTTLTSSANPSAVCQLVTLTAAITPANVTGSVTFFDGSATLGTVSVSGGSASFSTSAFTIGNHQILASYGGDAGHSPSTGSLVQTVSGSVTVTLSSSPNPSTVNQGVTMTATVAAPACQAAPSPTGSVSFFDGTNQIGQASVVNGTATFSASTLSVGSHPLSARYGGDTNYGAATSNTVIQTVNPPIPGGTTTTLTSSANPSAVCQLVTLTAAITPANSTGTVTFFDGSATLGSFSVSGGSASISTSAFTIGNHQLLASYGGDAGHSPSSGSLVQTVSGSVTVTLSSSPNPSIVNQAVTMTATVAAPACQAAPSPPGSVSFFDGTIQIGQASVVNGTATFSTSTLSVGSHQLSARYGGDSTYSSAVSNIVTQVVTGSGAVTPTATLLSVTPASSTFGQAVTLTATVTPSGATGTVSFFDGTAAVGAFNLANGSASVQTSTLAVGNHSLTASYGGDSNFGSSVSAPVGASVTSGTGGQPASVTASGGTPQSTTAGTAFPSALQVTVRDSNSNPLSGIVVAFTAPSSGASAVLSSGTATTNALGVASVTATANSVPGSYMVTAAVGALSASFSLTNGPSNGPVDLALGKPAAQSSTFPGYSTAVAASAVDGSTDGDFGDGSVTATNLDANPWWQVDLGASAAIGSIVIWNRTDCCASRLNDYWVFVSDTPFLPTDTPGTLQFRPGTFFSHQTTAPNPSTTIAAATQGRYVRVQLTFADYLSVAEVQVFGPQTQGPTDLALGKPATQSSTFPGYSTAVAASAVDGSTDGNFGDGSVTATNLDANPWWQVDLGAPANVNSVVIWNRTDCCASRLNDYWVFVSNTPFLPTDTPATLQLRAGTFFSHQTSAPNPSTTIQVGTQGRYVRVQLTGANYLSLAEVQVFGTAGNPSGSNLAQGKAVTQSSTLPGYPTAVASSAVDGNTDGNFGDGSVTATNLDNNAWRQLDLGASANVSSVVVWNRTDCCASRLKDYRVFVSNTPFSPTDTPAMLQYRAGTFFNHHTSTPNPSAMIGAGIQGHYVRV